MSVIKRPNNSNVIAGAVVLAIGILLILSTIIAILAGNLLLTLQ